MPESVDPRHLLLIGAGPGVGASVVRRFGSEGFRSTLISRGETLEQLTPELRSDGLEVEAVGADIEDLDGYRATLERIFRAPGAPGVAVYNAPRHDGPWSTRRGLRANRRTIWQSAGSLGGLVAAMAWADSRDDRARLVSGLARTARRRRRCRANEVRPFRRPSCAYS